jgi:hypothetical protein
MARTTALSKRGKTVDPTIEAARLTVMGTILVALISSPILTKIAETALATVPAAQAAPQVSPTLPAPTAIVPAAQPQPTASLPVELPQPEATLVVMPVEAVASQPAIPLAAGEDWQTCVDADLWQAYPPVPVDAQAGRDNCLAVLENGIYADRGDLRFYNAGRVDYDLYGISTPISGDAVVDFTVAIDELKSNQVWVGFTENANPWDRAWFLVFKPGGYIDIREVTGTSPSPVLRNYIVPAENNVYHVHIELVGNRPTVFVNEIRLMPNGVVRFAERNLFLGYMIMAGPEIAISAGISDLAIENK